MGQSVNRVGEILAPYARKSYNKYYNDFMNNMAVELKTSINEEVIENMAKSFADRYMRKEIKDGVQTIQYQINTLNKIGALISDNQMNTNTICRA